MIDVDAAEKAAQAARRDFSCLVYKVHGAPPASQSQALRDAEYALEAAIHALRCTAGIAKLQLPIPGKKDGIFLLPKNIDQDDWNMLKAQIDTYVSRRIVCRSLAAKEQP